MPHLNCFANSQQKRVRGVTSRAILLGILLIPLNGYWVIKAEVVWASIHATVLSLFFNVVFSILLLCGLNALLLKWMPNFALQRGELLTIYVMLCMGTSLFAHDMMQILLPLMSYPFWFATPENDWQGLFWRYIPKWLVVSDHDVISGYYEGNTSLYLAKNLDAWLAPIFAWTVFILLLYFVMICLNVFIRRQWVEHEKLTYPIIQLPREMADMTSGFWRNRLMWLGFAIAGGLDIIHGLHFFYPSIPDFRTKFDLAPLFTERPFNAIGWMPICFYPFVIGLAYFMPLDLSFSTWFFYLFWKSQVVFRSWVGWRQMSGFYLSDQSAGAWLGISIFALWAGRRYLAGVLRKVLMGAKSSINDTHEPMRYRTTALGIVIGISGLVYFCWQGGMSFWVALFFFVLYFLIVFAATRMRAELGPPTHDLYYAGADRLLVAGLGTRRLGPGNLTMFSLLYWITRDYRGHAMPHQLEGFKIAEGADIRSNRLVLAMLVAVIIGAIASFWEMLHLFYKYGGSSRIHGYSLGLASESYRRLQNWFEHPTGTDSAIIQQLGFGFGLTVLMMAMRRRFFWWPFHPVGYAVAGSWTMSWMWFSVLLSWIIKYVLLKQGGLRVYRQGAPFFLGLILGQYTVGSFWSLLGAILDRPVYGFFV